MHNSTSRTLDPSFCTGLAIVALGVVADAALLLQYPEPLGLDGYYYFVQLKHLGATHKLYYSTSTPAIFYIFRLISVVTRLDYIHTIKITAIALNASLSCAAYLFVREVTKLSRQAVWTPIACAVFGAHIAFIAEYIKELGAIACIAWAAVMLGRSVRTRSRLYIILSCIFVMLSLTFHRSAALIVLVGVVAVWVAHLDAKSHLFTVFLVSAAWAVPAIVAMARHVSGSATGLASAMSFSSYSWWPPERLLLLILAMIGILIHDTEQSDVDHHRAGLVSLAICIFAACVTTNPSLVGDFGTLIGRIQLTAYLQVALLAPILLYCVPQRSMSKSTPILTFLIAVCIMLGAIVPPALQGISASYMTRRERLVRGLESARQELPTGTHVCVITAHGDEFLVTAILGLPAQQHLPKDNDQIYWLLNVPSSIRVPSFGYAISQQHNESSIVLLDDFDCQKFWVSLTVAEREALNRDNPSLVNAPFARI